MWGTLEHVGSFSYTVRVTLPRIHNSARRRSNKVEDELMVDIKAVAAQH